MFLLDDGSAPLVNRKADSSDSSDEDTGAKKANWPQKGKKDVHLLHCVIVCFCVKL